LNAIVFRRSTKQKTERKQKTKKSHVRWPDSAAITRYGCLCRTTSVGVTRIVGWGSIMPSGLDWRSVAAYAYLDNLSGSEFAWEFLRRNPDYRRDHRTIIGDPAQPAEFRELLILRWGLPFRDRSGSAS
jgi:hypothetical protein